MRRGAGDGPRRQVRDRPPQHPYVAEYRVARRYAPLALPILLMAAAGCRRGHDAGRAARPNEVTLIATDYAFHGPARIPAGLTTLVMENRGAEVHWMELYKLAAGRALSDFLALAAATRLADSLPAWITAAGGPGWVGPGQSSNTTVSLGPGHYVLVCRFPSPDRVAHLDKGMASELHVITSAGPAVAEPVANFTVAVSDSAFGLSVPITAGSHSIRLENVGSYRHELYIFRLAPGKSIEDYWAWERAGLRGQGPGRPWGGVTPFEAGTRVWFAATFERGEYVFGDESGAGPGIFRQVSVR